MMMLALFTAFSAVAAPDVSASLHQELLGRDTFPGCSAIAQLGPWTDVREALVRETQVAEPAWVPMRAAECVLVRLVDDPRAEDLARTWLADPETPGFALMVVRQLNGLPEERAVSLAELAVKRLSTDERFARRARPLLEQSVYGRVRTLVTAPTVPASP